MEQEKIIDSEKTFATAGSSRFSCEHQANQCTRSLQGTECAASVEEGPVMQMKHEKLDDLEKTPATSRPSRSSWEHQTDLGARSLQAIECPAPVGSGSKGGGFSAWATVFSAFLIQVSGFGYASSFGVFQDFYVRDFLAQSTSSQISWIGSTQTFLMLVMGLFAGRLFDKGYCYHLVVAGSIILILSLFMLSLAQPEQYYQIFLTQGVGVGVGAGLSYAPSVAVIAHHFIDPAARARTMGIAVAGVSIGGIVHPILLNQLLHKKNGSGVEGTQQAFRHGTRASAGLITGLLVAAILLLRTSYPKEVDTNATVESAEKGVQQLKPMKLKDMIIKFATDWPYVCFVIGMTLYEVVFFFPLFYLQLYAIKHGLNPNFAFYSLSILNGASFFGRLSPGFFVHDIGVANILLLSTASATVLMFCMLAVSTVAGIAVFASIYGFFSGAFISMMNPMLVLLADSPPEIGARMGMCFAMTGFGSLIGTPLSGALLTPRYIWWRPIVFNGSVCVMGFLLFTACRVILGKRRGSLWII